MKEQPIRWILASGSPRRREILGNLGLNFEVVVADTDESSDTTDPVALVEELARRKAAAVRDRLVAEGRSDDSAVLLAADTVVISPDGKTILGKPHTEERAAAMLRLLSGNTHRVASGVAVIRGACVASSHEITEVTFAPLSDEQIARYVATGEPLDKAGAYGIQTLGALWVTGIRGDYFNVVGLPVHRLETLLREALGLSFWDAMPTAGGKTK